MDDQFSILKLTSRIDSVLVSSLQKPMSLQTLAQTKRLKQMSSESAVHTEYGGVAQYRAFEAGLQFQPGGARTQRTGWADRAVSVKRGLQSRFGARILEWAQATYLLSKRLFLKNCL